MLVANKKKERWTGKSSWPPMTGMRGHGSSCSNYSGMSVPRDYRAPGSISPCISCICHSARLITKTYYFLSWGYMDERSIIKTIKKGCTRCNIDSGESMNNFSLEWCREGETSWGYVWTRSWEGLSRASTVVLQPEEWAWAKARRCEITQVFRDLQIISES